MAKSIIGCDLNERYCQISYYDEELQEPKTLDAVAYPVSDLYVKAVQQDGNEELRSLSDFLGKVLSRFEEVEQLVFTVSKVDIDIVRMLKGVGQRQGIAKQNIYVQDYKESFCNYMLYQPKELWQYEAALFHCDRHEVNAYMLRKIRTGYGKGRDTFITIDEVANAKMEELAAVYPVLNVDRAKDADVRFKQFVQGVFEKLVVCIVRGVAL